MNHNMTMKLTNKYGPNVTVLLPGTCNARCDFCFWNRDADGTQRQDLC